MNEHDDVICQVRESFSGLHMDTQVENVLARSRGRRRRQLSGLAAAAGTTAVAVALTLSLGGPAPARSGNPPPLASSRPATLAAFSVTSGPGGSTTVVLYKGRGPQLDPAALRQALAEHGIPAMVTVGIFCRPASGASVSLDKVLHASSQADGSVLVINGQAIPPGTRLSIGLFPSYARMLLIKDGAPLSCSSTSDQPAVHVLPTGTPIRG